jgi:RNA recognition motif-containing protein
MITVIQVADWIVKHRGKGKAFVGYSYNKIIKELTHCANLDSMVTITDDNGNIIGVVCGSPDTFKEVFHVYDVLCIEKGAFSRMIKYFIEKFPNYTLEGTRRNGKVFAYNNVSKLLRLSKIYGK